MSRNGRSGASVAAAAQRARDAATQAVPMAKNAGVSARHSAEGAVAWAAPKVKDARSWAAPHVEQAGLAVRDRIAPAIAEKIAPAISDAIVEAAHRLDAAPTPRRRVWPRVLAGVAMIAAAGSAVAAAVLRRRPTGMEFGTEGDAPDAGPGGATATDETDSAASSPADEKEGQANGQVGSS